MCPVGQSSEEILYSMETKLVCEKINLTDGSFWHIYVELSSGDKRAKERGECLVKVDIFTVIIL